jgi:hypothetical protein
MNAALFCGLVADHSRPRLNNRAKANMMRPVRLNDRLRRPPMLERALPIAHPEITLGKDHATHRPMSAGAILYDIAGWLTRALHAVGAFFAEGGALS